MSAKGEDRASGLFKLTRDYDRVRLQPQPCSLILQSTPRPPLHRMRCLGKVTTDLDFTNGVVGPGRRAGVTRSAFRLERAWTNSPRREGPLAPPSDYLLLACTGHRHPTPQRPEPGSMRGIAVFELEAFLIHDRLLHREFRNDERER